MNGIQNQGRIERNSFIQSLKKDVRGKGDPPLSHKVWNGLPRFLSSILERSLGVAESTPSLRLKPFMSKGFA